MVDEHGRLLGRIEAQIDNLCERQDRHYESNRQDHQAIRDDLTAQKAGLAAHNDNVIECIATTSAEKISGDEQHSRIWSVIMFAIGVVVTAIGALAGLHFSG